MLTFQQAVKFIKEILLLPLTWRELLEKDPLEFLKVYMRRHAVRIPFQNMGMTAVDPIHRHFPSEDEIITVGQSGTGGCCIILNYFSMLVFKSIGLDTFVIRADHFGAPIAGTHCIIMVILHGPKHFGRYLVELGSSYPNIDPIPMDSDRLPFRILRAGGFPMEFREIAPGYRGTFLIGGGIMGGKFVDKDEVLRTSYDLKPRALWEFDYPMLETFTNPTVSHILCMPLLYRYFSNSEFIKLFPQLGQTGSVNTINEDPQHFIHVNRKRIVIGDNYSRQLIKNYESYEEMEDDLKRFFPMIPEKDVEKALDVFTKTNHNFSRVPP